jgi:hypothetical protein
VKVPRKEKHRTVKKRSLKPKKKVERRHTRKDRPRPENNNPMPIEVTEEQVADCLRSLRYRTEPYIDGKFLPADSVHGVYFPTENPATEEVICQVRCSQPEHVNQAVEAARRAFEAGVWRALPPSERKQVRSAEKRCWGFVHV